MTNENALDGISQGLVVSPGETLVISFIRRLNDQEADEAIERLGEILPGVKVVIVPEMDGMALFAAMDRDTLRDTVREIMEQEWETQAREYGRVHGVTNGTAGGI